MQSQNSRSQKQFQQQQLLREKSKSRLRQLQKTPTVPSHNPYMQQLGDKSTSKKRKQPPSNFAPPILIDQNMQLLAENRQMATIIQEKKLDIEDLQKKLDNQIQREITFFREIEDEKKRFIAQILRHKQETDRMIVDLTKQITKLQNQKLDLQRQYQQQSSKTTLNYQHQMSKQIDKLKIQYQQNLTLLKAQNSKLKEQIERKRHEFYIRDLQFKQKNNGLNSECEALKEEMKHIQHIRKMQHNEQKNNYQNKIQRIHLQQRRQKELFFIEHESQIKRLQDEISRLKKVIIQFQQKIITIQSQTQAQKLQKQDIRQKYQYQADTQVSNIRTIAHHQRQKLEELLKTQLQIVEELGVESISQLTIENKRLSMLVQSKQQEILKLMDEIQRQRQGKELQAMQQQLLVKELYRKLQGVAKDGEEETEALKVRLAQLRQADLTGLRQYHEHQIEVLSNLLQEKQDQYANLREKYHAELRKKVQMRKYFHLEVSKSQSSLMQLKNQNEILRVKLSQRQKNYKQSTTADIQVSKQSQYISLIDPTKSEQLRNLQLIIQGKDHEIQQLNNKIDLLTRIHSHQKQQWVKSLHFEKELAELSASEKNKNIQHYEAQIVKLKQSIRLQKQQFNKQFQQLRKEHRNDYDAIVEQLAKQKKESSTSQHGLNNEIKRKELEIQKLSMTLNLQKQLSGNQQKQIGQVRNNQKNQEIQHLQRYYKQELSIRDTELAELRERVEQLTSDLRDGRQNYCELQRRMEQLIESQSKLRQLETKVVHLGKQNNLVKNIKQINKNHRLS